MAVEEGWSFALPDCPESVCYSPSTNSVIACGKEGKISCYDLLSGQQLCEAGKNRIQLLFLMMLTTIFKFGNSKSDVF